MTQIPDLFSDSFLTSKLNPNFIEALNTYWNVLKNAAASEEEKIQVREALYNLVRFTFRHLFQPLYLKYIPKIKGKVFLLSAIHTDGIGDYFATLKCARILKEQHPELDIHLAYTHKQQLPSLEPSLFLLKKENIHDFLETDNSSSAILEKVLEGKSDFSFLYEFEKLQQEKQKIITEYEALKEQFPQAALAVKDLADEMDKPIKQQQYFMRKKKEAERLYDSMKDSLALIHIALALNTFDNPLLASKSLYFAESGNFQGIGNYLQRNWCSMGLDPFEEGIFLKKEKEDLKWIDVRISRFLWQQEQPNPENIQNYQKQYSLHLGYLPRIPEQKQIFIEMLCRRHVNDARNIDVILPKQNNEETPKFDSVWMTRYGISKIISVQLMHELKENILNQIDLPFEKNLRLIYILPIPHSDFNKLIHLSGEIVGCTGDGSLSDCIIAGKIPFYEVRQHKLNSLNSFKHLARMLTLPDVQEYINQLILFADWPAESFIEKFDKILNEGSFRLQWKTLTDFIKQHYCFENSFLAHVNRHLFGIQSWEINEKEEMLVQDYFQGNITSENAYETLEKMLKNRSGAAD